MAIELYDFQQEDIDKVGLLPGVMIANEMGTGKTVEALQRDILLREKYWTNKSTMYRLATLVVTPTTVVPSWERHCELFGLHYVTCDPKNRSASWSKFRGGLGQVFIVHWEALRLMEKEPGWLKFEWFHIIADECHRMQNRKAQMTQALKRCRADNRTAMSGTPTTGRPEKFWSALNWIDKKRFGSYWKFYERYVDYSIILPQGYHKIKGPRNADELLDIIDPYYVRRLKQDVLKDLPPKVYDTVWVDMTPQQAKAYREMKKEMVAWVKQQSDEAPLVAPVVIAQLVRLQQFACAHAELNEDGTVLLAEPSSKLDAVMEILDDNPDKQFVIFSNFKQLIRLLGARLVKAQIPYVELTGDTPQSSRGDLVDRFQRGEARVFTGTVQAGGVGITLTAASTVIFLNRDWSPAINLQAEDRLHRIGQTDSVQVLDVMARKTVDIAKAEMLTMKKRWIETLLGDI